MESVDAAVPGLAGRRGLVQRIDGLLDRARSSMAATLVVRGAIGVGKTAVLRHAAQGAPDFIVLSAAGFEHEADLPYAGLLSLLRPLLPRLVELDDRPAATLRGALALGPVTGRDRFAVGVATLELLSLAAAEQPLLVIIDDAQWLDASSRDAVCFALRRLDHESVAALLAVRPSGVDLAGFDTIDVPGLEPDDAVEMLAAEYVAPTVARALSERCGGNPLALLEVCGGLSPRERLGIDPVPEVLPLGPSTAAPFGAAVAELDPDQQLAALVAALEPDGDRPLVVAACDAAGLGPTALLEVERAHIVELTTATVQFRHPLARSAIVERASPPSRRRAHGALAAVVSGDRRLWHAAEATLDADDELAASLHALAQRALARGDPATASRAAARAAELTVATDQAAPRWLLAAHSALAAGTDHRHFVERALAVASDPSVRADAVVLAAAGAAWLGAEDDATELVRTHLPWLERADRHRAAIVMAFSNVTAWDRMELAGCMATAEAAWRMSGHDLAVGIPFAPMPAVGFLSWGALAGRPIDHELFDLTLGTIRDTAAVDTGSLLVVALLLIGELEAARDVSGQLLELAVERGATTAAVWLSVFRGMVELRRADVVAARSWAVHGRDLAEAVAGSFPLGQAHSLLAYLDALQGDLDGCREHVAAVERLARRGGLRPCVEAAEHAYGLGLMLGGRLEEAVQRFEGVLDRVDLEELPGVHEMLPALFDLVEAKVRLGRREQAVAAHLAALERLSSASVPTLRGPALRSVALLADDGGVRLALLRRALVAERHVGSGLGLARTELALGAQLRRVGDPGGAREHLRAALACFRAQGCVPWAREAEVELRAAGARPPGATTAPSSSTALTPQEERIVRLAVDGHTNRQIAALSFLSVKTVEMHMTRAYRKLGVHSRAGLVRSVLERRDRADGVRQ